MRRVCVVKRPPCFLPYFKRYRRVTADITDSARQEASPYFPVILTGTVRASRHHRLHVVGRDLARRGVPDIAVALDPAQRLVEILYAMRHAHQPGMDRQAEHLAALAMQQL